jgi:hypothetical protein
MNLLIIFDFNVKFLGKLSFLCSESLSMCGSKILSDVIPFMQIKFKNIDEFPTYPFQYYAFIGWCISWERKLLRMPLVQG